jgi:F-type H+-transporting ATPase subunit b
MRPALHAGVGNERFSRADPQKTGMKSRAESIIPLSLLVAAGLLAFARPALAAEAGDRWGVLLTIGRFFNLALVIGVLIWIARKPLAEFFAGRTATIREQLEEARNARMEAEAKLAEIESRMSRLDDELRAIKESAERDGQKEYERLVAVAEQDAEKVLERARQEIDGMTRAAQNELKAHAAEIAVRLAEEKIRRDLTDSDRERLFDRFITRIGGPQ